MADVSIDLNALQKEIDALSREDLMKQVVDIRTRQKIQQKKNQNSDVQIAYRKKRQEQQKLLIAKAKQLGLYDQILAEAEKKAAEKLNEAVDGEITEADVDETEMAEVGQ